MRQSENNKRRAPQRGVSPDAAAIDVRRIRRGMSWTELAAAAGVSGKVRTKLSAGQPVSIRSLRAVAKVLEVQFAEIVRLLDGDELAVAAVAGLLVSGSAA